MGEGWLDSKSWYKCALLPNNQWEFRFARRPTTNRGDAKLVNDKSWNPYGDIVKLCMLPKTKLGSCFVQERSGNWLKQGGFEQASAALNKWSDSLLTAAGYSFTMDAIFAASRECQDSSGDPFNSGSFYPGVALTADSDTLLSGNLPKCLFNIPIFEVGSGHDLWCKYNIGGMHGGVSRSYFTSDKETCIAADIPEWWSLQSDTLLCLSPDCSYLEDSWTSRPGCEKHDRGIHLVGTYNY